MLECVLYSKEAAEQLKVWRFDPHTMQMSFRQKPMDDTAFWSYFQSYFVLKELPPLFAVVDGKRCAFIGFTPYIHPDYPGRRSCEISIVVAPDARGKGVGGAFLEEACRFAKQQGYEDVYARIKPQNTASIHVFEHAGFEFIHEVTQIIEEDGLQDRVAAHLFCLKLVPRQEPKKVFIIAEAGSNWRLGTYKRDRAMAKSLIEAAKEAGCDAVKFQVFRADTVYVENAGTSDYLQDRDDIRTIFDDLAMPYEMISELASMCKTVGIEFMSTAFSLQDFAEIDPYVQRHKIASYEISHVRLLEACAKSNKPLLVSTGASTLSDISWAVSYLKQMGCSDLTLLQCSAQYPATSACMNLRAISTIQRHFQLPVGLSDHSFDPLTASTVAVALGASVIEKHFTLDRHLPGPDHSFAVNPDELKKMCQAIRLAEAMLGTGIKEVLDEEKELYLFARRRLQAIMPIAVGDTFIENRNIAILRPGKQKPGCHPRFLADIIGKKAKRSIALGEGVNLGDF